MGKLHQCVHIQCMSYMCAATNSGVSINDCLTISILLRGSLWLLSSANRELESVWSQCTGSRLLATFREFITRPLWRSAAGDRYAECLYCPGLMFISAFYGAGLVFELNGGW